MAPGEDLLALPDPRTLPGKCLPVPPAPFCLRPTREGEGRGRRLSSGAPSRLPTCLGSWPAPHVHGFPRPSFLGPPRLAPCFASITSCRVPAPPLSHGTSIHLLRFPVLGLPLSVCLELLHLLPVSALDATDARAQGSWGPLPSHLGKHRCVELSSAPGERSPGPLPHLRLPLPRAS